MRYVVGYQSDERGGDAVAVAVAIARAQGAKLDIMLVLGEDAPYVGPSSEADHPGRRVDAEERQILTAQQRALALVPKDVEVEFHVREGSSPAAVLIETAVEFEAALIVVGAASNGLFKRYTVGTVANALLHASPVPVALAPRGYKRSDPIERLTAFIGQGPGADAAVDVALVASARRDVPLRFVSLVELDERGDHGRSVDAANRHADTVLGDAVGRLPKGHETSVEVVRGRTFEEAVESVDWLPGELVIIGSSRLAQKRRLFLGSIANKVLRVLPVPLVVVPLEYERAESRPLG
ncbi:universal stress protein [Sinomonas humi]|uniref:Universal stress protein UspA n=1 Tax=Sinomonas humi TaxID=1338436 RepID=A0A0B2AUF9_9MICC|nr:universal stress protein [Sinomonas humi]KHL05615.1 universal stress protein UspA [Sinomonas humi]